MKKTIFPFILLPLLALTSCYNDVDPNTTIDNFYNKRRVTIEEKNVVVNVGEEKFVKVDASNLDSAAGIKNLTFSSCDPNIATAKYGIFDDEILEEEYQGMYILGKSAGFTSIIASYKNAAASVSVDVISSDEIPYIHLFDSTLCIEKGVEYVLPSNVLYEGNTYDVLENNILYLFSILDGEDESVASFSQDEETGDILIDPLKAGSTKVLVSTVFKEKTASTLLSINVIESGASIVIKNKEFNHVIGNEYSAKLCVSDFGEDYKKSLDLDIEIYENNQLISENIELVSDNPEIVKVDGYKITGLKKGNTFVRGSYNGISIIIQIIVDKPVIQCDVESSILEVDVSNSLKLTSNSLVQSDVIGLFYENPDSENIFESYETATNVVNINKPKFHELVDDYGKEKKFYIETEQIYIETQPINVYSKVIRTFDDLANWGSIAEEYITENYNFNGYFILGNNIDCPDEGTPVAFDRTKNFKISGIGDCVGNVGFNGIFDGQGYTINNYKPKGFGSFITWLTSDGELKNVGFNNVTLDSSLIHNAADPVAVLIANGSSEKGCNVSNIYVNYKKISTNLAKYANKYCGTLSAVGATMLSCSSIFINALNATINGDYDVLGKITCNGVYALGGTHVNGNGDFGSDTPVPSRIFNCTGTYGHYTKQSDFIENLQTQSVISNWDDSYWVVQQNSIPVWKSAK